MAASLCPKWVESRHLANGRNGWKADTSSAVSAALQCTELQKRCLGAYTRGFAPLGDRVRVACFVEIGAEGNEIPPARISALLDAAREVLGYAAIDGDIRPWAGQRPATPSGRPIIGRTPVEHLYLNVGHGALGWTLAAGSARLVCDAIAGRTPTIDVRPYMYQ